MTCQEEGDGLYIRVFIKYLKKVFPLEYGNLTRKGTSVTALLSVWFLNFPWISIGKEHLFKAHNKHRLSLLYWNNLSEELLVPLRVYSPKLMLSLPTLPSAYTYTKDFEAITILNIQEQFKENKTCKLK